MLYVYDIYDIKSLNFDLLIKMFKFRDTLKFVLVWELEFRHQKKNHVFEIRILIWL